MSKTQFKVYLDPDQAEWVKHEAKRLRSSEAQVIRAAVAASMSPKKGAK